MDRKAALTSQEIRGFRPYHSGDDPRQVDWKITAKRGTLYVREPTGLEGGVSLISVDLPARTGDPEIFARFMMAISSAVEGAIAARNDCSLLVVAGPEIVRFISRIQDIREALAAFSGLLPFEPRTYLYRAPGPAALAARVRHPGAGADPCDREYHARLRDILSAFAVEKPMPFTVAIRGALSQAGAAEVRIFSLLQPGDKSHLIQFIHEAKVRGMRVVLQAPAGAGTIMGVDAVEVL
ncbi:DUF58 domain-containing protein [Methanoculleus thermophilus]|uniref:DUF58 domain-containing protein n=1 Tax=Methanoculleus thermophilus TaxID=2200 RepID=A0A1G9ATE3_9EURY|nr:DUF58 domain-containing protein [Methanoculleus thermophilus]SDK29910.1 Protein of unknown function DUF58 [Methanoculleus thermophilus]